MAITIVSTPQAFAPIKNPLTIKLQTDNQWLTAPSLGVYGFRFFDSVGPVNDDSITISYNNNVYTFIFKTTVGSGAPINWIPTKPALIDFEDWITFTVAPKIAAIIGNDFNVQYAYDDDNDLDVIVIASKRADPALSAVLSVSPFAGISIWTIGGPFPVPRDPKLGVLRDNFKVFARIFEETAPGSNVFQFKTEIEGHPDEEGNAELFLNRSFVFPDAYPSDIDQLDTAFVPCTRRYEMQVGEKYGTPVQYHNILTTQRFRCFNGGFSHIAFPDMDDVVSSIIDEGKFFNVSPRTIMVNKNMPFWINFIAPNTDHYNLEVTAFYENNFDDNGRLVANLSGSLVSKTCTAIGVGMPQIDFIDWAGCYEYRVRVTRLSDEKKSEVFRFIISDVDYEFSRYFYFKNSLGAYEVIWLTGESQHKVNLQHMVAEVNVPPVYTPSDAMMKKFNTSYTESREIPITNSSRFMNIDANDIHRLYIDLCLSDDVYVIENGKLIPIIIDNKAIDMPADAVNINTFNLSFTYAASNRAFTPSWL
jgi:hypothetical protein